MKKGNILIFMIPIITAYLVQMNLNVRWKTLLTKSFLANINKGIEHSSIPK